MEVVLTEDIANLGKAGQVVKVREGYGRNFLIPQKKALPSNPHNIKAMEHQRRVIEARALKVREEAQSIAGRLMGLEVTLEKETGSGERLFGSVTRMDIADALKLKSVSVDKHQILLESPLKHLGSYDVEIKLHADVSAAIKVHVVKKTEN